MPDSIRLVRHATLQIELGGRRILVDPMLGPAGVRPPIEDTPNQRRNPLVDLPEPAAAIVEWAELVLVTHLHEDHWDPEAAALIGDRLPVLCQPDDLETLRSQGIAKATAVGETAEWEGLTFTRTGGMHGTGELAEMLAPVSGYVVRSASRSVYVAGDTVWCPDVAEALALAPAPDAVVVNAGGARFLEGDPITMTSADVLTVRDVVPGATLVAVHCEAINHCVETRAELAAATAGRGVVIPADGESVRL